MATAAFRAGSNRPDRLFDTIGAFLAKHGLSAEPNNYDFAYRVVANPASPLAQAVAALTEGGVRLTARDIQALGGHPVAGPTVGAAPGPSQESAGALVARAQLQADQLADITRSMQAETQGFGRDLRASADAIRDGHATLGVEEVVRLTSVMLDRVRRAEARIETATRETEELRAQLDEARDHARRDPLTGLANRRAFEEAYAAVLARAGTASVAICDVDRFKSVNDRFGHPVGDRVLRAIAEVLSKSCGEHLVARYGGEEFAVLFDGLTDTVAHAVLEHARALVQAKRYKLRETDAPLGEVTFSAGLTATRDGERIDSAMQRADALLYEAKQAGRNRIMCG